MKPLVRPTEESDFSHNQKVSESQQEETQTAMNEDSSLHFQLQLQRSTSDVGNTSQEDYDEYRRQMTAGFEEMYQEMYRPDNNAHPVAEFPGHWGTEDSEPSIDESLSISDPRSSRPETGILHLF